MKMSEYLNRTHTLGRIANIVAMAVMLGIPAIVCTVYDIWPTVSSIIATAGPLLAMFIPSALSEVISFTPITGSSGYVGAIMGNVSNIKFPCAMSAMERTNSSSGTEQGEVIFARYGNPALAIRHVESVAAATLLQSAPSVEKRNTDMTAKYANMASKLDEAAHNRFLDLLNTEEFTPWFSCVTPLTEVGLLPIGSRPAKRGLGAKSLDDLRTIPWVFSWSQARINLAAWYGLGTACEKLGDLELLQRAYREWPLFNTFIDNIEMSIAKTDNRIAKMYLALGDRADLADKVFDEMMLTRSWVLRIVGDAWPLEHRRVLGQAVRVRNPFVDALSLAQVRALREVRANQDELSEEAKAEFMSLVLETVTGVSAGLQNTG